jgi:AcrR family transcriptional regulator
MRHFARDGYALARVEDVATELKIAKGSVFQHFGSKEGLFLAAYRKAVGSFHSYLHAPRAVQTRGFFATLRYWLLQTERLVREDWIPYRMALLGNYASELTVRREINRFLRERDPYGTAAFVQMGLARGELRRDVDQELIVSLVDWTVERFQDALLTEELDPGLFRRAGAGPERNQRLVDDFLKLLRGAVSPPRSRRHWRHK